MGDQIGVAVNGELYYVRLSEFNRFAKISTSKAIASELFAAACRINALYMIATAGSGHIGSSFSSMDIMAWIQNHELGETGIFYSSKGHDSPALYATMMAQGKMDFDLIHKLRRLDGLPGHPDIKTEGIVTNTGSLGMGISKAKGMISANRLNGVDQNVYVMTGDGELQEGQIWESLGSAVNQSMGELTVIVDHNKLQSDTLVSLVSDLGDLESKFRSFGWHVSRCDGNDMQAISATFSALKDVRNVPKVIIADTIKGKGVSFMEHTSIDSDVELYKFHSGAPDGSSYRLAVQELIEEMNRRLALLDNDSVTLEKVVRSEVVTDQSEKVRLIPSYTKALIKAASLNNRVVALDADLILDTGLIEFKEKFADRFFECGIAEQDMVSQAGGMALAGLLPVVHSFGCFLTSRPQEQIYNNATEDTKIVYVGSLAGVVPGGPGHSHQAVRDISTMSSIPKLVAMEPSCPEEVGHLLDWCISEYSHSSYIRLMSLPWEVPFEFPESYRAQVGVGVELQNGSDAMIIAYGPVLLSAAVKAAQEASEKYGFSVAVINLPWLNKIDINWLRNLTNEIKVIFSLDNHVERGGQGDTLADALLKIRPNQCELHRISVFDTPVGGTNEEVLRHYELDQAGIVSRLREVLS